MYGDPIWEKTFRERGWGQYPSEEVVRFYMKYGKPKGSPRCLDIGCGAGANAWMMAKENGNVICIDGADAFDKLLCETIKKFTGYIHDWMFCDITQPTSLKLKPFDIMVDCYSLYANHINRIYDAYRQYYDLLKPGGYFLTCFFGSETSREILLGESTVFDLRETQELENFWIKTGYKIESREAKYEIRFKESFSIEKLIYCLTK